MNENLSPNSLKSSSFSVSNAASELRQASSDLVHTTGAQVSKLKERALEAAQAIKHTATEKADHFRAAIPEKVSYAKDHAQLQWDEARVKAKEIHITAEDYIRQNPTKTVLGALGIGFLIGLIARK